MPRLDTSMMNDRQRQHAILAMKAAKRISTSGNKKRTIHTLCMHLKEVTS